MFGLLNRMLIVNLALFALVGEAWRQGWLTNIQAVDDFHICKAMAVIFLGGLLYALVQARWLSKAPIGTPRLELARRCGIVKKVASFLPMIGLMGTLVGVYIALTSVNGDSVADAAAIGPMVGTLIHGMGMALIKTLVGGILNVWLRFNYDLLDNGAVKFLVAQQKVGSQQLAAKSAWKARPEPLQFPNKPRVPSESAMFDAGIEVGRTVRAVRGEVDVAA